jgi:hypothetical protein
MPGLEPPDEPVKFRRNRPSGAAAEVIRLQKRSNPRMNGIDMKVTGDKLVLTIDLTARGAPSSTGKTLLVASTRGAVAIEYPKRPGLKVAVNVTVPT